jgi:hypothetical protein
MRFRTLTCAAVMIFAFLFLYGQSDPAIGTWKFNAAKSKYSPGTLPKSVVFKVDVSPQGRTTTSGGVDSAGKPIHSGYTAKFDGKDYPIKGDPDLDTVALKLIDQYTYERIGKRAGKVVQRMTVVVAKDGKTLTTTSKGTTAQGQAYDNIAFYEKQ